VVNGYVINGGMLEERGYLKIHVVAVVDIRKKKVVSLQVTSEDEVHDSSSLMKKLVDHASENNDVKKGVIADGGGRMIAERISGIYLTMA
jgi:hypothetical protein